MADVEEPIPWDLIGVGITISLASLAIGLYGEKVNPGGQSEQSIRSEPSRDAERLDSGPTDTNRGAFELRKDTNSHAPPSPHEDTGT